MATKLKQKLLKKSTVFNGKKITLFSLDGVVWSSRDWEPEKIKERQETEKIKLEAVAGGGEAAEEGAAEKSESNQEIEADDDVIYPIGEESKTKAGKSKEKGASPDTKNRKPKAASIKPKARETSSKTTKKKVQPKRKAA